MAKVLFDTLFTTNQDGSLTTKEIIRIGGVTLPSGYLLAKGIVIGGVDLTQYIGHELEVTIDNGNFVITAIY